ncbi:alpha/beta fold hydrolase [Streptomyces sp. 796.1]|uniref:alpha/beta fold hydrolase n=1 Tax=Streptomyces sp. 796.1 TaxID=3163029 RepID=UPI0039C9D5E4
MSDGTGGMGTAVEDVADGVIEAAARAGWRRGAGIAGAAIGVVAAGAAVGVAVERLTVGRGVRRKARLALDAASPYGTLRGRTGVAVADDGTELVYEVAEGPAASGDGDAAPGATDGPPLTVVFCHGYCLSQDSWHFQRAALAGRVRAVYWDQRSHGRSERGRGQRVRAAEPDVDAADAAVGPVGGSVGDLVSVSAGGSAVEPTGESAAEAAAAGESGGGSGGESDGEPARAVGVEPVTIDLLGRDLKAVIDAAAPEGPLVLVGHSMGGMTVMALAAHFSELVRRRVVGAAFIGTSAGKLSEVSFGLPAVGVRAVRRVLPGTLRLLGAQADLVERGRRATADLFAGVIKRYSFGSREVDPGVARFAERLIEATPVDVVAEFYPAFAEHDKTEALPVFAGLPVLVLAGERDLITPSEHSEAIAEFLPEAHLEIVPDAGHLVMLEHPETVNAALCRLLAETGAPGFAE